jgi:hypothetical protein
MFLILGTNLWFLLRRNLQGTSAHKTQAAAVWLAVGPFPYMVKAVAKIICVYFRPRRLDSSSSGMYSLDLQVKEDHN